MKHKILGVLLLVILGVVKVPMENHVAQTLKAAQLRDEPISLGLRETVSQMAFAASLGGLRSLVASITYLRAYVAFEDRDWGRVDSLMTLTTRMQPKEPMYWDEAAWHMAYNAATNTQQREDLRAAIRNKEFREYVLRGLKITEEGLVYNPDNPKLLIRKAEIYRDRLKDPRPAAEAFLLAAKKGAKPFYERMGAYELVKLGEPQDLQQAYEILKRHYDQGFRYPSVLRDLDVLERKLNIPPAQRVDQTPAPSPASRRK
jgi:hypothetical protein